ncbi:MAG: nucleoside deaminase [Cyanobacteriota bacterium]
MDYEQFMEIAFEEAKQSLKEGNKGFGCVIVSNNNIVARTHDTDNTDNDSTAHAELKAIKEASKYFGKDLSECIIISTHEPCPMCSGAIIWSKISKVIYSTSITESLSLGRNMVNISFRDIVNKASFANVEIIEGVLKEKCINLYKEEVRHLVKMYRCSNKNDWEISEKELLNKRLDWVKQNKEQIDNIKGDDLEKAYKLLCLKLEIDENEAPVVDRTDKKILFHSKNFCPSLEACKILDIDTREMCRLIYERPTDQLIKSINPELRFSRNYECLRPYTDYCEEFIEYINKK